MKKYRGIRYSFRPKSYWDNLDPLSAILQNVTGENRRQMIVDYWKEGRLEDLDPALLLDESDPESRTQLGRIHPSFMGGEYLPAYLPGEVEIARICLQSTTSDVISVRARPVPKGIAYRIVDEYEGEFSLPIPFSEQPLTLEELIKQFDEGSLNDLENAGGIALCYNVMSGEDGGDRGELRHFTRIRSVVYRQLGAHYENVFDEWVKDACNSRDREAGNAADEST